MDASAAQQVLREDVAAPHPTGEVAYQGAASKPIGAARAPQIAACVARARARNLSCVNDFALARLPGSASTGRA